MARKKATKKEIDQDKVEEIARRRGFFWRSSEIYGGVAGFYDYAHLGALLKRKWESLWRDFFLGMDNNFYEIDATNMMPEDVFKASGHLKSFVDPICKCKKCGNVERADHIVESELNETFEGLSPKELESLIKKHNIKCEKCGGKLSGFDTLNMMFSLEVGTGEGSKAYLRPETAQGAYVNFKQEFETLRKRLPLGLAIVGRAFRNEISPRNALMRMREFNQAELQIFFDPGKINNHENFKEVEKYKLRLLPFSKRKGVVTMSCKDVVKKLKLPKFFVYYMAKVQHFYLDVLCLPAKVFRLKELGEEEKAFYNKYHWDVELDLPSLGGFKEIDGIHYRTDHDLAGHQKVSKQSQKVNIDGKSFIPHVLELSFGVDRNVYALIELSYKEEKDRTIMNFPRLVAPFDTAVFPLVSKDRLPEIAKKVFELIRKQFYVFYDESGSIGRRYARQDEIGTPACVTIDHQTKKDKTVTLRDRDTKKQIRVKIDELPDVLTKFLSGIELKKLGKA